MNNYRQRIYQYYVHTGQESLAPATIEGLNPRKAYLTNLIKKHFPVNKDANILDLGCGHGTLIYFARQAGYTNIRGVDGSPQQVEAAKQLGITNITEGHLMDALAACADESLDAVVAFDIIEHFTKDEVLNFVDEVYRVLKKNEKWIIHAPNAESIFFGNIRYGDFTHELAFTRASITQLLKSSKFAEVNCYEDEPVIHGVKSLARWLLWKVIRGVLRFYLIVETGAGDKNCIFTQNFLIVAKKF